MAELGDFVAQGRRKNCEVTLEMMDYKHVDTCSGVPELRSILQALKSGEHGKYPHLERHTEKRILGLLPEKDRKRSSFSKCAVDAGCGGCGERHQRVRGRIEGR